MPVEKKVTKLIERIYKNSAENLMMFIWIKAQQSALPAITIKQAIMTFRLFTGITVEEWDDESISTTYNRLQTEWIDFVYKKKIEEKC